MNKNNQALLSDLIVLAHADDKVTDAEYDFITRVAKRMNISKEEIDLLFKDPLPSKTSFTEVERITHFHKLVLLMNVDRETHENEVHTIRLFGIRMGIRPGAINRVLIEMENFEDKIIPPQHLIQIFQTYYN